MFCLLGMTFPQAQNQDLANNADKIYSCRDYENVFNMLVVICGFSTLKWT